MKEAPGLDRSPDDLIRKVLGPCEIRQDKGRQHWQLHKALVSTEPARSSFPSKGLMGAFPEAGGTWRNLGERHISQL